MAPLNNYNGAEHWVGFAPQTEAGTPEDVVSTFFPTTSLGMYRNQKPIERKSSIATGRMLPSRKGIDEPASKVTAEALASQPHPWYWALGACTTTQPDAAENPTVYLHEITEGDGPINLTGEANRVFDMAKQGDLMVAKLKLAGSVGEVATIEMETLGLTHTDDATLTSVPVFPDDPLTVLGAMVKIDGELDQRIQDFEINYDGKLELVPTLAVRRKEPPSADGKFKFIDYPADKLSAIANASTFSLVVLLAGAVISGEYNKFLQVELPACQFTGGLDPDIGTEVLTGDADFSAFYDVVTERQIRVIAQNTVADITV